MKYINFVFIFLLTAIDAYSQIKPIEKIFLLLPNNELDLTLKEKRVLLDKKVFYPAYNTDESIEVYKIQDNSKYDDRLSLSSYFETGQTLHGTTEIRYFLKKIMETQ